MKLVKKLAAIIFFALQLTVCFSGIRIPAPEKGKIFNIEVSQQGQNILISYDLTGQGEFVIELFYSTDYGQTWIGPLEEITGAIGENQVAGTEKKITWNVLNEVDELTGSLQFQIIATAEEEDSLTKYLSSHSNEFLGVGIVNLSDNISLEQAEKQAYKQAICEILSSYLNSDRIDPSEIRFIAEGNLIAIDYSLLDDSKRTFLRFTGKVISEDYNTKTNNTISGQQLELSCILKLEGRMAGLIEDVITPNEEDFETKTSGTFTDERDGHVYQWVKIGNQIWMAENLAYLPKVSPPSFGSNNAPGFYVFGYEGTNVHDAKNTPNYKTLGVLYNKQAAKIACPKGWYLPTNEEWIKLAQYISDSKGPFKGRKLFWRNIGGCLKSKEGWYKSNNGTDDFGFDGHPSGFRILKGEFNSKDSFLSLWTENTNYVTNLSFISQDLLISKITKDKNYDTIGLSIRCIKSK